MKKPFDAHIKLKWVNAWLRFTGFRIYIGFEPIKMGGDPTSRLQRQDGQDSRIGIRWYEWSNEGSL
jgi:hypothetical protein